MADQDMAEHLELLDTVRGMGVSVHFDSELCKRFPIYGAYMDTTKSMILCSRGDAVERRDTLRHEVWHIVQDYQDCNLLDSGMKPLGEPPQEEIAKLRRRSAAQYGRKGYAEKDLAMETEAFLVAAHLSAKEINTILTNQIKVCNANNR